MRSRGFTLVELVMVIVIMGIMATSITIFLKPAIDSFFDSRRRADLTDMADTALRRMGQDIRSAVSNSVRSVSASCFQLVPTITGGRYRMAPDTVTAGSTYIDTSTASTAFDALSPLSQVPATGDWVVIDNQNTNDVYAGTNRAVVTGITTPSPGSFGQHRITFANTQFPIGYDGGRFVVVPNVETTVFYSCSNGILYRGTTNGFATVDTTTCGAGGAIVATDVASCTFVYDPSHGATQQNGFVWMRLELSRSGESIMLSQGVHVDNVP
ncbi:MSHA biogenesis protein MshO [Gammaproteobacteria bacterium]